MDENKLKKLRDIGYIVIETCGLCKHFSGSPHVLFGVCAKHKYNHLKHTDSTRPLSVTRYGACFNFEIDEGQQTRLHKFSELLSK